SISAQARSIRIGNVTIIGHVSVGVVAVLRLIGVVLVSIGRLVAIASAPIRADPVTAVIGCRPDTDAHAKTRDTDPQALRVGRSPCRSQRDGGRNSDSKCSHSNLLLICPDAR